MRLAPVILLLAIVGPPAQAQQDDEEIYVCRDANGEIIAIQVDPCPELPAPKPAPPKAAPKPKPRPKPKARAARPAPAASPAKTRPHTRRTTTRWQRVQPLPARRATTRRNLSRQTFPTRPDGTAQDSANPNFATPEQTWRTFLAATESNDPEAAAACLTPEALASLAPAPASLPLDDLQQMLRTLTRIENEGEVGPFWAIQGVRPDRRPKWILFEETNKGVWKIAGI